MPEGLGVARPYIAPTDISSVASSLDTLVLTHVVHAPLIRVLARGLVLEQRE